jgi:prophage regulatory protein
MRFLTFPALKEKGIPWSRMHVDREEKAGRFPRRRQLGPNTVAWVEKEIDEWMASRPAAVLGAARRSTSDAATPAQEAAS